MDAVSLAHDLGTVGHRRQALGPTCHLPTFEHQSDKGIELVRLRRCPVMLPQPERHREDAARPFLFRRWIWPVINVQ